MTLKASDEQISKYDKEHINDERWGILRSHILSCFKIDQPFTFVDLGGGNGNFADRVLDEFPNAKGLVLDNSQLLISKNIDNPRKRVVCDSIHNAGQHIKDADIVFINWVLHHLVTTSYRESVRNIQSALQIAKNILNNHGGHISVFEIMYDGFLFNNLPSRIIFKLSSSKLMAPLFAKSSTANSVAGVGVCFLSYNKWSALLNKIGFSGIEYVDNAVLRFSVLQKLVLHLGNVRHGHFWIEHKERTY